MDYTIHYARLHQFTDDYYETMAKSYRPFISRHFPSDRSVRILDIGCGTGFLLNALRAAGYANASGIDTDLGQVNIARSRGLPVRHREAIAGEFDVILLIDVLEHVPRESQIPLLQSIHAALAPGGRLICQVPNALFPLATYNRYIDWTHHFLFSVESLAFVLENAGFAVDRIEAGHDKPSPPRGAVADMVLPIVRGTLQAIVAVAWRIVTVSYYSLNGLRHPVSANLLAVAHKP